MEAASTTLSHRGTASRRLLVAATTTLVAVAAWTVIEVGFGVDLRASGMDIGAGAVAVAAGLMSVAAIVSLAAFERWAKRPHRAWRVLAGFVFLVSLGGPLFGSDSGTAGTIGLLFLHVVVAAGLILWLPGKGRR